MLSPDPGLYHRFPLPFPNPTPAVFLDRDGTIIRETGYLHKIEDVTLLPGAAAAIRHWNQLRIPVIEVTNQAGIARGYYTWREFEQVEAFLAAQLAQLGAHIDATVACGYHTAGAGPLASDHPYRKPRPGMLLAAAQHMCLDLAQSWMIGDKLLDLEAAIHAGLRGAILVRTGYGADLESQLHTLPPSPCQILIADNLQQALPLIGPL